MGNTLFELILSKNSKFSVNAEIWLLDYFECVKFDGDGHFSVLDHFLQVLFKKSMWHFRITGLLSQ